MASKRPIKTMAWRAGKLVRTGHAATLRGAITNNVKRIYTQAIAVVEVLNRDEQVLATIRHISIHGSVAINLSRLGARFLRREKRATTGR